eukprot:208660_1
MYQCLQIILVKENYELECGDQVMVIGILKVQVIIIGVQVQDWYIKGKGNKHWGQSSGNLVIQCGSNGDIPVPGDYFGEGIPRVAVWRPSNGNWYIKGKGNNNW